MDDSTKILLQLVAILAIIGGFVLTLRGKFFRNFIMNELQPIREVLKKFNGRKARCTQTEHNEEWWIIDNFNGQMYLGFDLTVCEEFPHTLNTIDIFACRPGSHVRESSERIEIKSKCNVNDLEALLKLLV